MSNNAIKKRNWAFVLYIESAPSNWLDILIKSGLSFAVSPYHDKDLNPDGEVKKAHYHIILCYSGPTSFNVVSRLVSSLNQPMPIPLEQVKGYYRYFTHKDNPEKYQYKESEIRCFNGFNILDYADLTNSEILAFKCRILDLILDLGLYEYCDLIEYLKLNNEIDLLNIASNNTLFFNSYLKSRYYKMMNAKMEEVGKHERDHLFYAKDTDFNNDEFNLEKKLKEYKDKFKKD